MTRMDDDALAIVVGGQQVFPQSQTLASLGDCLSAANTKAALAAKGATDVGRTLGADLAACNAKVPTKP